MDNEGKWRAHNEYKNTKYISHAGRQILFYCNKERDAPSFGVGAKIGQILVTEDSGSHWETQGGVK